ncbi:hypothetical protein FisN_2Lh541 [Fistulifera solaris]|uniref:Endonuclease I n=1 Tax=Fistulifera solaris TaxID=1519565 RepID=A0A1Z5JAU5_FISSO|nr:hypothetical protein FisN_2Lh541 [Fistulifera solaris]|eukprot:GAX11012.1 hypothetical protein FisN_2Lh541 [Fistulifera solaris]
MSKINWKSLLLFGLVAAAKGSTNGVSISSKRFSGCSKGNYYDGVNVEDRDQLEALVTSTHRRVLPYTSSNGGDDVWLAMRELHPGKTSDTVRLIYSQTDMAISLQGELDGWNREHLWPRSYGVGDSGADYTDVHSIVPSDWNVNTVRANKYFGTCADSSESQPTTYNACIQPAHSSAALDTQTDAQTFLPPASVRGDIARALMYMDVRYSGAQEGETDLILTDCPGELDNSMGFLSQLLQWHVEDPVNEEERTRNADICTCWQGNRNPFIDFPDLAMTHFASLRHQRCEGGVAELVASDEVDENAGDGDEQAINAGAENGVTLDESEAVSNTDLGNEQSGADSGTAADENGEETDSVGAEDSNATASDADESINDADTNGSENRNGTHTYGGEEVEDDGQRPFVLDNSVSCPGPGSIMVVGFNSDYPDTLALVALERLSQGTTLYITDNGWTGTDFRDTEGYLKLEVPSEGIAAGAVFGYSQNTTDGGEFSENNWESVRGNFDLSLSGDTILVVCDDNREHVNFLTGLTFGGRWFNAGGDTTYSALPEMLEQFNYSYVTLSRYDSYRYKGSTSETAYRLREAIANPDNWESVSDLRYDNLSSLSFEVLPAAADEGDDSSSPISDPQIDSVQISSDAQCLCWNVLLGALLLGLHVAVLAGC